MRYLFSLLLFSLTVISCSKSTDKGERDNEAPVVTLDTPADNQSFTAGQSINISGHVTDNRYIEQIHIVITNLTTGEQYLHIHIHPAANTATFNQPYTVQAGISYLIQVIGDDASSNSSSKQVQVSCN